jgi:hypothetical protein
MLVSAAAGLLAILMTFTLFFAIALDLSLVGALYFVATHVSEHGNAIAISL